MMLLRNDEVNEDGEWSLKVFSKYGIGWKKELWIYEKAVTNQIPYVFIQI